MNRRRLLAAIAMSGCSGCLRLTQNGNSSNDSGNSTTDTSSGITQSENSTTDTSSGITLSEGQSFDRSVYQIWTYDFSFFTSSNAGAARISQSGRVMWEFNIPPEIEHNAVDSFAVNNDIAIFGYTADPHAEPPASDAGARFYALNTAVGSEEWMVEMPSDGSHQGASGATIINDTGVVAASGFGSDNQPPVVYGIDIDTGDRQWELSGSDIGSGFVSGLLNYNDRVYIFKPTGSSYSVDPTTGSNITQLDFSVDIGPPNRRGKNIYFYSRGDIISYSLQNNEILWTADDLNRPHIQPVVDNSIVVAGDRDGRIYAYDRAGGENLWSARITNSVFSMDLTADTVFICDRELGLYGFNREDGTRVHESTKDVSGSDIGIIAQFLLIGGESTIYEI